MSLIGRPSTPATQEREILLTGIGGQGVQLAAKVLALAATREAREVMSLGTYGGTMRGGNTDATVVIGDGPLTSPPIVSQAWSIIVVHPRFAAPMWPKLRSDSLVLADADLRGESPDEQLPTQSHRVVSLPATTLARDTDAPKAAALVLLGAFAALTGIVATESLGEALSETLPSYRSEFLAANLRALEAGAAAIPAMDEPAWAVGTP